MISELLKEFSKELKQDNVNISVDINPESII